MARRRRELKRGLAWVTGGVVAVVCSGLLAAHVHVKRSAQGRIYTSVEDVPVRRVGLVLGCTPRLRGGRENLFFGARMKAAADLYRAGKVRYLLVSGDNRTVYYNEPKEMREALVALGVEPDHIYLDYAGRRTLDSVVRARKVFGLDEVTVISQRFHNERAVFIAGHHGLDAIGYDAQTPSGSGALKVLLREWPARVQACADIYLFDTPPHFLGDPVVIGEGEGDAG